MVLPPVYAAVFERPRALFQKKVRARTGGHEKSALTKQVVEWIY